jgi:hypothetical protein
MQKLFLSLYKSNTIIPDDPLLLRGLRYIYEMNN